jgi:hypothetical protein
LGIKRAQARSTIASECKKLLEGFAHRGWFETLRSEEKNRVERSWGWRDFAAASGLFFATAGVILWQNAHVAVFFDFSYVLDSAARMALGQRPYRDFPFVHAPLTFLIQAAVIRLTGRVFFHHALYEAMVGGLGTLLTWRIVLRQLRQRVQWEWALALVLAAPLAVLGIYCIVPAPNYDCDCVFSLLVAIWLLQRMVMAQSPSRNRELSRGFAAGAAICVPLFFKQNIGLAFLTAVVGAVALLMAAEWIGRGRPRAAKPQTAALLALSSGVGVTLMAAGRLIHFTFGIHNYIDWTIRFAAERRLPELASMINVYRDPRLLWTLPAVAAGVLMLRSRLGSSRWGQIGAFVLLAAPFAFTLCSLLIYDDADERGDSLLALWPLLLILAGLLALAKLIKAGREVNLLDFMPVLVLAAVTGAMMSQQLWGSTYAIWPLLMVLVAELTIFVASCRPPGGERDVVATALGAAISITLLVCGGFYTASEERLSYIQLPDGPAIHSAFPQLAGMATPGPYLPEFDELLRFAAANIPANDGLILIPGEDPFYFVTGRVPRFPVLLFDPTTDPYSPEQVAQLTLSRNIRWLVVKRDLQIKANTMPQREATMKLLMGEFTPVARLRGYDIYRR